MSSITSYIPDSDIEVEIEYEINGDNIVYSAAYIDGAELPATKLFYKNDDSNKVVLADIFNAELQDKAIEILRNS